MRIEDYPAQEPFTEIGTKYHNEVLKRGSDVAAVDIHYGADPYQGLAVHKSEHPNGDVLVFMHGGGWTNGYKEWMSFMAAALNAAGVTFVSLGYRLAPGTLFPYGYEDTLDGVAKTFQIISAYGGNPERLFVGGHSAGGHYAALMALKTDWQEPRNLPCDVIKGCLPISGTYYFGEGSGFSMRPRFLGPGGDLEKEQEVEEQASPMTFAHANAPPFLIAHGGEDFPHLIRQAEEFEARLSNLDVDVMRINLPGCNHLSASYASGDADGAWLPTAVSWMKEH